jgi:serine/threonine-protein kinase
MGSVYKARHQKLDKMVALKVLPPELAGDQEYLDRFLREARAAAKLNHKNIVQALDVGESYGYHYFVMEFVDGRTIKDMIEQDGPVSEGATLDFMEQIGGALEHAWAHGMVHRDIKPSNIIVNEQAQAKLCDLGLAKSVTEDSTITQTGVIMGTPFYLSPEQARSEDLDCRSDIYSLGVTMFHMLTGQVPFTGNSAATILYKHIFLEAPKVKSLNPRATSGISDLVSRMLAKSRDDRPQSPTALIAELRELRGRTPSTASGSGRVARADEEAEPTSTARTGRIDDEPADSQAVAAPTPEASTGEIGEFSGPNTATAEGEEGDVTVDEAIAPEASQEVEVAEDSKGLKILIARPRQYTADAGDRTRLRLLLVASVGGLLGIASLLYLRTQQEAPLPSDPTQIAIDRSIVSFSRPHQDVAAAAASARDLRSKKRTGEAVALLLKAEGDHVGLPGPGAIPLTGADEQALAQARKEIVSGAKVEFNDLLKKYNDAVQQPGADLEPILRGVRELDAQAIVRLMQTEKARLTAERDALRNKSDGGDPPR